MVEEGFQSVVVPQDLVLNEGSLDVTQHSAHIFLVVLVLSQRFLLYEGHIRHKLIEMVGLVEEQRLGEQTDCVKGKQVLQDYFL